MPLNEIEAYLDWLDSVRPDPVSQGPDEDLDLPPAGTGEDSFQR